MRAMVAVTAVALLVSSPLQAAAMSVAEAERAFPCESGTRQTIEDRGEASFAIRCVDNQTGAADGPYWEHNSTYVTCRGQYRAGKKNGRWMCYGSVQATVATESNYTDGLLDGIQRYTQPGDFHLTEEFVAGVVRWREWAGLPNGRFPARHRQD